MTKLMFCGECGDVVSPGLNTKEVRWCQCKRHAVWWDNPHSGQIRVHDSWMPERTGGDGGQAWIIGLHNGVLTFGGLIADHRKNLLTKKQDVEFLLSTTPDTYLFKTANSLVVRISPGSSNDTAWSQLP